MLQRSSVRLGGGNVLAIAALASVTLLLAPRAAAGDDGWIYGRATH